MLGELLAYLKTLLKYFLSAIFFYSGIYFAFRAINNLFGRRLTIITYHRVTDKEVMELKSSLPFLFVNKVTFNSHITFLKKHYHIISFKDLENLDDPKKVAANSLIITFDDGYEDNYLNAFPILQKHSVLSTLFLATDKIGKEGVPWWDELFFSMNMLSKRDATQDLSLENEISYLLNIFRKNAASLFQDLNSWDYSRIERILDRIRKVSTYSTHELRENNRFVEWDQIDKMKKWVEFGSHTCSHTSLNSIEREDVIRSEIIESKREIESKTGNRVLTFSYPAGHYSEDIKTIVEECDYSFAVTQDKGIDTLSDRYAMKRINLWEGTTNGPRGEFSKCLFAFALSSF